MSSEFKFRFLEPLCVGGFAITILLSAVSSVGAQAARLEWNVTPARGSAAFTVVGRTVFGPVSALELEVMIRNDEDSVDFVRLEPGLFEAVSVRLITADTGVPVPLLARWSDTATCRTNGMGPCPLSLGVSLPPEGTMRALVVLTPKEDEEIPNAHYRIALDFTAARKYIRSLANEQWQGTNFPDRGSVPLVIKTPETPAERHEYFQIEGGTAQRRGDLTTALQLYDAFMREFPSDAGGYAGVGTVMLELGRFDDAAVILERALQVVPARQRRSTALRRRLATAYVAMGQEEKAVATLRQQYPDDAENVSQAVERARREVNRIRARP